jgi:hypothetical protein
MEMNVEKNEVMRFSRKPSTLQFMPDQKQLENVEYFSYLCKMMTNVIKFRITMAKAAFNRKKSLFRSKL